MQSTVVKPPKQTEFPLLFETKDHEIRLYFTRDSYIVLGSPSQERIGYYCKKAGRGDVYLDSPIIPMTVTLSNSYEDKHA